MKIWVGDKLMLDFIAVVCFCIYYFVYEINQLLNTYKDAAGIWHEDRFRPLVTALSNLAMNLILVQFWGIYGVLLSTVLSTLIVGMPWLLHNLFTVLFDKDQMYGYLLKLLGYAIVAFLSCISCYYVCHLFNLPDFPTLIVRACICCIVPNAILLVTYHSSEEFQQCICLVDKMTKGKFKLEKRLFRRKK